MGGYHYQGHTEMLAALTGTEQVAMMHVTGTFRIILATTHLPLKDVPGAVTEEMVLSKIRLADYTLKEIFRIKAPQVAVTALNPHSGEDGLLAYGEDDRITAAIEKAREFSINAQGPFPADTLFRWADDYDMIIFMYHDQGSIPFKWIARGRGVNWTLGLPFTRTSVDHGTGFDIAGKNLAAAHSLTEAVRMAAWSVSRVEPEDENSDRAPAAPPADLATAPYSRLAGIYDHVMRHVDYALWKRYLFKLFQRHRIPKDRILELAAGTGRLAELFTKAGTQLTAMDRSGAMLEVARLRLERKNKSIPLVVGDLRDLPFKGSFPVVLCLYDSINYMMNRKEFLRCLKEVHRITEANGFFVFDVTTEANSMRHFTRELSFEETDDFSYLRRSYYNPVKKIQHNDFTIFMRDDGLFSRFFEAHEQKIYFHQEIRSMVEVSGFELLEALAGFTFSRADDRSTRIHYILQKRGKADR
jgi:ubiquinone/menaquinone biosynthesis C-methylase UbiE